MVVVDIFKLAEERYFVQVRLIGPHVFKLSQDFLGQRKGLILWDNQPNEIRVMGLSVHDFLTLADCELLIFAAHDASPLHR
ncbi:hypothetical protein [Pseudomonas fragi]|uniref:hypothetical protein n=1 Tax=Pseudomonas fragi TaxID=296 RepID=UPI0016B62503|nr:hypothetical protein [Pseudomonas fragi]NNB33938.1 hypothetical protein [Pseudomonas fragi]